MSTGIHSRPADPARQFRLVELLAPLSLVTDQGMGAPDEQALRSCLVATGLARRMGMDDSAVGNVYYATLLEHLGCTATAHEEAARLGGDELATRPIVSRTDFARPGEVLAMLRRVGSGRPLASRARASIGLMTGESWGQEVMAGVCEVGAAFARQLGMPAVVETSVGQMFERWDGKGSPGGLRGETIQTPARFAVLASQAVSIASAAGVDEAIEAVGRRAGGWFDPTIATAFETHGRDLLSVLMTSDALQLVVELEPMPWRVVSEIRLDEIAAVFGRIVDLKSTFTLGHSIGVADLALAAGRSYGLQEEETVRLRRAALLHDLGRVGVPAGIWEKRGRLTQGEWERVRLHAYQTERILARSPGLAGIAELAGMHHERLDGSGYHRQAKGLAATPGARLLAAADAYHAMTEPRPHRRAMTADAAAEELRSEVMRGRLDGRAADAVLVAAGKGGAIPRGTARSWPAGLSDREVEVIGLVARGESNPSIARRLGISRRTAEHHVQHVYDKIGVSTRAGAALFAVEHGLLGLGIPN